MKTTQGVIERKRAREKKRSLARLPSASRSLRIITGTLRDSGGTHKFFGDGGMDAHGVFEIIKLDIHPANSDGRIDEGEGSR